MSKRPDLFTSYQKEISIFPNNTYLTISESSAWATLKYFKNENLNEWTNHLLKIHDQEKSLTKA